MNPQNLQEKREREREREIEREGREKEREIEREKEDTQTDTHTHTHTHARTRVDAVLLVGHLPQLDGLVVCGQQEVRILLAARENRER
jgi:phosphohistidine phosphatase SixA